MKNRVTYLNVYVQNVCGLFHTASFKVTVSLWLWGVAVITLPVGCISVKVNPCRPRVALEQ